MVKLCVDHEPHCYFFCKIEAAGSCEVRGRILTAKLENAEASSFDASAATATAPAGDATTAIATSDAVKHACGDATNVTWMQR